VVQQKLTDGGAEWGDITSVTGPQRTKRPTIIQKALNGVTPPAEGWTLRVLDEESAREITVALEEQPPRLKIG